MIFSLGDAISKLDASKNLGAIICYFFAVGIIFGGASVLSVDAFQ